MREATSLILGLGKLKVADGVLEAFQKRVREGRVFCEYDAPKRHPGSTASEWMARCRQINESRICAQILSASRSACGNYLVGEIRPAGSYGRIVELALEKGLEKNLTFGMRAMHSPIHEVCEIVTYDLINYKD